MARRIANSLSARAALLLALAGALIARPSRADTVGDGQRAQQLFDEGRALMRAGKYSEGCAKLSESQKLDPGAGTLLNLGICHAQVGRTATAFTELQQALAQARADGRADRERTAQKHIDALIPELSLLTLKLPAGLSAEGLRVELDGVALDPTTIASPIPLDPGEHRLRVSQPNHQPWSSDITIAAAREQRSVDIPALSPDPEMPAPVPAPLLAPAVPIANPRPPASESPSRRAPLEPAPAARADSGHPRWLGYGALGLGAAAIGAGTYFGLRALTLKRDSDRTFQGNSCVDRPCVDDWTSAKRAALASDLSFGLGIAALGVGAYFVLAPAGHGGSARVSLAVTGSGASVSARTDF